MAEAFFNHSQSSQTPHPRPNLSLAPTRPPSGTQPNLSLPAANFRVQPSPSQPYHYRSPRPSLTLPPGSNATNHTFQSPRGPRPSPPSSMQRPPARSSAQNRPLQFITMNGQQRRLVNSFVPDHPALKSLKAFIWKLEYRAIHQKKADLFRQLETNVYNLLRGRMPVTDFIGTIRNLFNANAPDDLEQKLTDQLRRFHDYVRAKQSDANRGTAQPNLVLPQASHNPTNQQPTRPNLQLPSRLSQSSQPSQPSLTLQQPSRPPVSTGHLKTPPRTSAPAPRSQVATIGKPENGTSLSSVSRTSQPSISLPPPTLPQSIPSNKNTKMPPIPMVSQQLQNSYIQGKLAINPRVLYEQTFPKAVAALMDDGPKLSTPPTISDSFVFALSEALVIHLERKIALAASIVRHRQSDVSKSSCFDVSQNPKEELEIFKRMRQAEEKAALPTKDGPSIKSADASLSLLDSMLSRRKRPHANKTSGGGEKTKVQGHTVIKTRIGLRDLLFALEDSKLDQHRPHVLETLALKIDPHYRNSTNKT